MISEVHIRDIPLIENLIVHTVHASVAASDMEKRAALNNIARNIAWWCSHPTEGLHLVSLQEERIAGVVLVKEYWNLCSLFVHPDYQGRGIGRALMETAIEQCRMHSQRDAIKLNAASNAVAFYERLGFVATGSPGPATFGSTPMMLRFAAQASVPQAVTPGD